MLITMCLLYFRVEPWRQINNYLFIYKIVSTCGGLYMEMNGNNFFYLKKGKQRRYFCKNILLYAYFGNK